MSLFCNHKWELVSESVTESKYEHSVNLLRKNGVTGSVKLPPQLSDSDRKHIQIIACENCGKLKRFVEDI